MRYSIQSSLESGWYDFSPQMNADIRVMNKTVSSCIQFLFSFRFICVYLRSSAAPQSLQ